ncbi:hypothetical protein MKW94_028799, partial [Papaver nudicaule]|nr:hypothetical protein [Papaver nudicaule]
MATGSLRRTLQRASSALNFSFSNPNRLISHHTQSISSTSQCLIQLNPWQPTWAFRTFGHSKRNPNLEAEYEPPKKKWKSKKKFKMQLLREKTKRKLANKKDPRNLTVKGKKQKFLNPEERIKDKIEKVRQ